MERGDGLISHEDLAAYRPVWRDPIEKEYRGFPIIAMPPASSGGVAIVEALNILETFGSLPAFDRNTELFDPAFCDPPIERLTSKAYARELRQTIDLERATPSAPSRSHRRGPHYALQRSRRRWQRRSDDHDAERRRGLGRRRQGRRFLLE
jgi:gamma-glutamyltranspeptidase / glutathione hydrolase